MRSREVDFFHKVHFFRPFLKFHLNPVERGLNMPALFSSPRSIFAPYFDALATTFRKNFFNNKFFIFANKMIGEKTFPKMHFLGVGVLSPPFPPQE